MRDARRVLVVALLALAAGGCANLRLGRLWSETPAPASTLNASVPTADQLAAPYRTQAAHLERTGQLRLAAEAWTTSLALAPGHEPSRQALKRLRERIDREVAEHLRRGWHALARDGAAEARRHFLAALALDPKSRATQDALRATSAPSGSDSEAKIGLPIRPTALTGSEPRFHESPRPRSESNGAAAATGTAKPAPLAEPNGASRLEVEKPEALYAAAKAHLAARRDEAAYNVLVHLARVNPGYRDAAALLRDLRPRLARQRYQDGMRLFREELLEDAIEQWRGVLEVDPTHAEARRNIEQAERMLRTLAAQPKR